MKNHIVNLSFAMLLFSPTMALSEDKKSLSVHVLNQQTGRPAHGVEVRLEHKQGESWNVLNMASTDANGRIEALWPENKLQPGEYRVVFKTGKYFSEQKQQSFFPEIPVEFYIMDTNSTYHIPLLLSQYGYSTYRGN
jgi:5-hydroxyisourate hydrolase